MWQWQFEDDGWWDMCPELNDKLELVFAAGGAELTHTVDENVEYDYDLTEMTQQRYEGRHPCKIRSIRRVQRQKRRYPSGSLEGNLRVI